MCVGHSFFILFPISFIFCLLCICSHFGHSSLVYVFLSLFYTVNEKACFLLPSPPMYVGFNLLLAVPFHWFNSYYLSNPFLSSAINRIIMVGLPFSLVYSLCFCAYLYTSCLKQLIVRIWWKQQDKADMSQGRRVFM